MHAALKQRYAGAHFAFEVKLDGYVIDLVNYDRHGNVRQCVEVQTGSFGSPRDKWRDLASRHPLRVVYPIAHENIIVMRDAAGAELSRKRSPRKGRIEQFFAELVAAPDLLTLPNFSLEVVLVRQEDLRELTPTRKKRWLRPHKKIGRRLIDIVDWHVIECAADALQLLPDGLPATFTTADLAKAWRAPRSLAQKACYCLRELDLIRVHEKKRAGIIYVRH